MIVYCGGEPRAIVPPGLASTLYLAPSLPLEQNIHNSGISTKSDWFCAGCAIDMFCGGQLPLLSSSLGKRFT